METLTLKAFLKFIGFCALVLVTIIAIGMVISNPGWLIVAVIILPWLTPAFIGFILGYFVGRSRKSTQ